MKILLGANYFIYFGTLGVFLPFFNLFCRHLGFSGFQIGLISSVKTAAVVIFPVLWAMAADRLHVRKTILLGCTAFSAFTWGLLYLPRDFFTILVIISVHSVFYSPVISFLEAYAMEILGKDKKKYGGLRVWGSIAFILTATLLGKIVSVASTDIVIPLILVGMIIQMLLCFGLPGDISQKRGGIDLSGFRQFFTSQTILFLVAAFLMLASHGAYYGFFSIYLENSGFNPGFIGFAWALASIAEISVMAGSDRIFSKFGLKKVLLFSFFAAVVRWGVLFVATSSEAILFSQLLHAFTYGSFHIASILAVDRLSSGTASTFGQAVNNAVTYGAGMMAGFMLSGILYDSLQEALFMGSACAALVGGVLMFFVDFKKHDLYRPPTR